jgi:hypothetical protein
MIAVTAKHQARTAPSLISYGARRTSGRAAIVVHIVTASGAVKLSTVVPSPRPGLSSVVAATAR